VAALADGIRRWLPASKRQQAREEIRTWARAFHVRDNVQQTLAVLLNG
jgi:hypothetical protein